MKSSFIKSVIFPFLMVLPLLVNSQNQFNRVLRNVFTQKGEEGKQIRKSSSSFIYQFKVTDGLLQDINISVENMKCRVCEDRQINLIEDPIHKNLNVAGFMEYPIMINGNKIKAKALPDGEYTFLIEQSGKKKCEYGATLFANLQVENRLVLPLFGAAVSSDNSPYLYWSVEKEYETERYDIEKKAESKWEFVSAHEVSRNSDSPRQYTIPVRHDAGKNFYRIKRVKKDNTFLYSDPLEVDWNGENILFDAFPNPANSQELFVALSSPEKKSFDLSVENQKGEEIFKQRIHKKEGGFISTLTLNNGLSNGVYLVKGTIGNVRYSKRIVVL